MMATLRSDREAATVDIHGWVEAGYEGVQDAFADNFATLGDIGAAFCLYVTGRKVVDIWGGTADTKAGTAWTDDTLSLMFSTTKGVTAICAHLLAQRGQLDLDAPVVDYWPEFGTEGKSDVRVRDLLSHRAGLPVVDQPLAPDEALAWQPAVRALAAQRPAWEPGTGHGYHAVTFGWLIGEVIRRATGRSPGVVLADEVAGPLGLDLWIGLPASQEHRVSRLVPPGAAPRVKKVSEEPAEPDGSRLRLIEALRNPASLTSRALSPTTSPLNYNARAVHAGELPAVNGIGTARALARLYAAAVGEIDGIRLLSDAAVRDATIEQSNGPDRVLQVDTRFGSGFMLPSPFQPLLGSRSFGHAGSGGSLAFADPERDLAFAYVMNRMGRRVANDPRSARLIDAIRQATG